MRDKRASEGHDFSDSVIINAMWRSGSTYLGHAFARTELFQLYYEPFHETAGNAKAIRHSHDGYRHRALSLRHPLMHEAYFDIYLKASPLTGERLCDLQPHSVSLHDVYRDARPRSVSFLRHCAALARNNGRRACFGFCRSGLQHARIDREAKAEGATVLHLWRDPREQFLSYGWPHNNYFMSRTVAQLLCSDRTRSTADAILRSRSVLRRQAVIRLAPHLPRRAGKLARELTRGLAPEQAYALFYLSWCLCRESGRSTADLSFSLSEVAGSRMLRSHVESRFGVDLSDARRTDPKGILPFAPAPLERYVEMLVG